MMAAGDSTRFVRSFSKDFKLKKQWLRVGDEPLWLYATRRLSSYFSPAQILITASPSDYAYMRAIAPRDINGVPCLIVQGGDTRAQSLRNALESVKSELVMVSDVARYDVPREVVDSLLHALTPQTACVAPALGVADTSLYVLDSIESCSVLKREGIRRIQTPQLSRVADLRAAFEVAQNGSDFSDESSALHTMGRAIALVCGSARLEKLTFGEDMTALASLNAPSQRVFIGQGVDVHAFENGKAMWLGGVKIESAFGFKAHSDGDVALHALCDAILGAIGGGDIGEIFPDDDARYAGADSKVLLSQVYGFAQSVGYELHNADITIMAQKPKLLPYKDSMRGCIAEILGVGRERVNIKATTTEGLGFVGRSEGVCAQAVVGMGFVDWRELRALLRNTSCSKGDRNG